MTTFRVGQRVRIKWSYSWPELNGKVGTIVGEASHEYRNGLICEWLVSPDAWGTFKKVDPADGSISRFAPNSCQLVPITDSYDKVEWAACLWMPEHMRDVA